MTAPASFSVQATRIENHLLGQDNMNPTYDSHGRIRVAYWNYTTTTADNAAGAGTLDLCEVPVGARILGGRLVVGALGTGVTASIGPIAKYGATAASTKYLSAAAVATAGETSIANTAALNYGTLLAFREREQLLFGATAPTAAITVQGHLTYVVD